MPPDLQQVVEDLGQCDLMPISAPPVPRHKALPPGAAWDEDARVPGVIIASVEADPLRGERCFWCHRPYEGEGEEAGADRPPGLGELRLLRRLIDAVWEHRTGCDVQLGRCFCLLAFYLGLLPDCGSEAQLAGHLGVDPALLSRSKLLLPPELQARCHVQHRPRKLRSRQ